MTVKYSRYKIFQEYTRVPEESRHFFFHERMMKETGTEGRDSSKYCIFIEKTTQPVYASSNIKET